MSDGDEGYVHDPSNFDESGQAVETAASDDWVEDPTHPEAADREFGRQGWLLVGVIVFAFLVAPGLILWQPPQLPYYVALLILPLAPAVLLGAVAVWVTTRP